MNSWGHTNFMGNGSHGQNMSMNQNALSQNLAAGVPNYVPKLQQMQHMQSQQMPQQQHQMQQQQMQPQLMQQQQMQLQQHQMQQQQMQPQQHQMQLQQHQMQQQQMQQPMQQLMLQQMQQRPMGMPHYVAGKGSNTVAPGLNIQQDAYTASAAWPPIDERQEAAHGSRSSDFVSRDSGRQPSSKPRKDRGELEKRSKLLEGQAMRRPKGHGWPREKHESEGWGAKESERNGWAMDKSSDYYRSGSTVGSHRDDKHFISKKRLNSPNDVSSKCPICEQTITLEDWVQHATTHADKSGDGKAQEFDMDYLFIKDLLKEAAHDPRLIERFGCQICGVHSLMFEELVEHIQETKHMHALYRWMFSPSSPGHRKYKEYLPNIPIRNRHLKCHFCEVCVQFVGWDGVRVERHVQSKHHLGKLLKVREELQWVKKGYVIRSEGAKANSEGRAKTAQLTMAANADREFPFDQSRRGAAQFSEQRRGERRGYRSRERDEVTSDLTGGQRSRQRRTYTHNDPWETARSSKPDVFMQPPISPLSGQQYNPGASRLSVDSFQPHSQGFAPAQRDFQGDEVFRRGSSAHQPPQTFNQVFGGPADYAPSVGMSTMDVVSNSGGDRVSSTFPLGAQQRGSEKPGLGGLNRGKLQEIVHSIRSSSAVDKDARKSVSLDSMKEASRSKAAVLATLKEVNQKMSESRSRQQPLGHDRSYSPAKEMALGSDLRVDERSGRTLVMAVSSRKVDPDLYAPGRTSRSPNRRNRYGQSPDKHKYSSARDRRSAEVNREIVKRSRGSPSPGRLRNSDRRRRRSPIGRRLSRDDGLYPKLRKLSADCQGSTEQRHSPDCRRLSSNHREIDSLARKQFDRQPKDSADRRVGSPACRRMDLADQRGIDSPDGRRIESADRRRKGSPSRRRMDSADRRRLGSLDKKQEDSSIRQRISARKSYSPNRRRRSPDKRRGSPVRRTGSADKGLTQSSFKERQSDMQGSDVGGFLKRTSSLERKRVTAGRKAASPVRRTSTERQLSSSEHCTFGENLTQNLPNPGKPKRRLSPLVLSPSARESLTRRIEATWQKYYHKYYSCVVTNPEIVLEMQKEYLRSYKGFFKEDPFFEFYYTKVAKPEDLREALTLRIDRGSPGPDPNSDDATDFIDPLLRQQYDKGLPDAHTKALLKSLHSQQTRLSTLQASTGDNIRPPKTADSPQKKVLSSGNSMKSQQNSDLPHEVTGLDGPGKTSVHEYEHNQKTPVSEIQPCPKVVLTLDEEVNVETKSKKGKDSFIPSPTKQRREDMSSKHRSSSPLPLPTKSSTKPNVVESTEITSDVAKEDISKNAVGSINSDGIFPEASHIYINEGTTNQGKPVREDRFKDRSEQMTGTLSLKTSKSIDTDLDIKWSADYLSTEPVITSTTQGLPVHNKQARKVSEARKSRSVLGRLGPQRKQARSTRSDLYHPDDRKPSSSKLQSSSLNDEHSRSKPHTSVKPSQQSSSNEFGCTSKKSGSNISARLGPQTSDKCKSQESALSEIFADPFLGFVHKTLTGIILIGEYQKSMATSSKPEDILAKINLEQEEMKARMLTSDGHLLIQLARCCVENPNSIEETFPQVTADVGPILRSLDAQVVTLIADTPIIIDHSSPSAKKRD